MYINMYRGHSESFTLISDFKMRCR